MNRISPLAGLCVCLGALLGTTSTAQATCFSSTPAASSFADNPFDGDSQLAPELTTITVATDAACNLAVSPGIDALIGDDAVFTYIDRDSNPATGSASFLGADIVVGVLGETGPDLPPLLGVWNGVKFAFDDPTPVGTSPTSGGFSANVDRLGIAPGAVAGIRIGSIWQGLYDSYADFAPEPGAGPSITIPVNYSTTAPAPPPTVAPAPAVAPVTTAEPEVDVASCTVPKVKGRSRSAAEDRLLDSGCDPASAVIRRYSGSVRKGRVIGTTPGTGARTTKRVKLIVSKGRKPARARTSAASRSTLERLEDLANGYPR